MEGIDVSFTREEGAAGVRIGSSRMVQAHIHATSTDRSVRGADPRPMPTGSRFLRYVLVGLDVAALIAAWLITTMIWPRFDRTWISSLALIGALAVVQVALFTALGLYRARVCR